MSNRKVRSYFGPVSRIMLMGLLFLLPVLMFVVAPQPAQAVSACSVDYDVVNQWGSGFQVNVTVTNNTTTAVDGWDLTWTFDQGQAFSSGWNASFAPSGSDIAVSNPASHWNGTLGANGGTAAFGFQGTTTGGVTVPTNFAVNGVSCLDDVVPTDEPTVEPTDEPTVEPTDEPTVVPTDEPTVVPTDEPTVEPTTDPGTDSCSVDYVLGNQWSTGFQADVTITNNSSTAVQGWDLVWTFAGDEQFDSGWNANFSNVGQTVTVSNPASAWNGNLAANGGTASFGFQGTHSGNIVVPATFTLNGDVCGDGVTPTIEPTVEPTVDPTVEPTVDPTVEPTVDPTVEPTATVPPPTPLPGEHVQNPFVGSVGYINPNYAANVMEQAATTGGTLGAKMEQVAEIPMAVWMDRIGAIYGSDTAMSLEEHLDAAVAQQVGSTPVSVMIVVYDLPNRDCSSEASNGELRISENGLERYKTEYIDAIYNVFAQAKYKDLRIVAILEPDSLPNLITNLNVQDCAEAQSTGAYVQGVQYAIDTLHPIDNVYIYLDIAHSGWLGWDSNFGPAVDLYTTTIQETVDGFNSIDGFVSNTSGYTPVEEPFLPDDTLVIPGENLPVRSADFYEWNPQFGELAFVTAFRDALIINGFPTDIGMLVDTARNGWGGIGRPTAVSTATTINDYVDESRIDLRPHRGGWCNQADAGMGQRPTAAPADGVDAYVWVKPPGESDGISDPNFEVDPDDPAKQHDPMCDPTANSVYNNAISTNALDGAPHAGRWFAAQFQMLVENAYPPLE